MSITYGFYNSLNFDRPYDAVQLSKIFDGIINDGIFASVGTAFVVEAGEGTTVNIGVGRAWFNHTWTYNDAIEPRTAPISAILLDRIDALVLEVDESEAVRANSIKFVQGIPSSQPVRPTLASSNTLHQYPLCYINRPAGSTEIKQSNIVNMVGTQETPFVTGPLRVVELSELLLQYKDEFEEWFNSLKDLLSDDVAGALAIQILELQTKTAGVVAQTVEATFSIASTAWVVADGMYTYEINNAAIAADKEVKIVLDDACKAKYAIYALDPVAGSVTLCVDARPVATVTGRVLVREVRA